MIRQQLRDRVTITSTLTGEGRPEDQTVRAHVFTLSGTAPTEATRPFALVAALRCIIGPEAREVDPNRDRIVHHGTEYRVDGPPMGRYRNGKIHHWTLNLERITG